MSSSPGKWAEIAGQLVANDAAALRHWVQRRRHESPDVRIALVPTMGALHAGHLALCDLARKHADLVVMSIFVNPTQFAPHEDLGSYPRTLPSDCAATHGRGVDLVFAPDAATMYPDGFSTAVTVGGVSEDFCALSRPHFFGGVALVVLKLLNLVGADVAVFGEKDWQQLQVIRRMARDLDHPTAIVGAPLVRDVDGLALSSRNAYLDPATRARALALPRALQAMADAVADGETDAATLVAGAKASIAAAGGRIDYVAIAEPTTLVRLERVHGPARVLAAVHFGSTRLIDNIALHD